MCINAMIYYYVTAIGRNSNTRASYLQKNMFLEYLLVIFDIVCMILDQRVIGWTNSDIKNIDLSSVAVFLCWCSCFLQY